MPLPPSCSACVFVKPGEKHTLCGRHAPSLASEAFEIAYSPRTPSTQRCGAGASPGDKGAALVPCIACMHWYQPDGRPAEPYSRRGLPRTWWDHTGFCTRHAPSASGEEDRESFAYVTHATFACGDGARVDDAEGGG
jgi:hypothetical protein